MIQIPLARFIDRYVGISLCSAFHWIGRFTGRNKERLTLDDVDRILISKFWGLGSLVEATPAFRAVRRRFPKARITFLTLRRNRGVFDYYPHFDEILYMRDRSIPQILGEFFKLPRLLRRRRFDLVLDMDPVGRFCALVTFRSGAPIRVGFATPRQYREKLYTRTVPLNEDQHVRRIFLDLLTGIGVDERDLTLDPIAVDETARANVSRLLQGHGVAETDVLVGINVNASDVAKERRWPPENFARLAQALAREKGVRVVMFGGPDEVDYVTRVAERVEAPVINAAGRTTLLEMAELAGRCRLFISNDSGPLHVAVAMGVPTISFFGPETPKRYGPIGPRHRVFFAAVDCSPCISFINEKQVNCPYEAKCIRRIAFEPVLRAALDVLGK